MLQLGGRLRKSKSWVSCRSENLERKACVKLFEGRSSRKVEMCASRMEESHSRHEAWAQEEEAIESEIADDRQESGRRPLLVAS